MADRSAVLFTCQVLIGAQSGPFQQVQKDIPIVSWNFEETEGGHDKLKLVIENFDLRWWDDDTFLEGNVLQFAFGYPGNMSPTREAVIQKITGGTKMNVEALARGVLFAKQPQTRTFENMKRSDIARQIAVEQGFDASQQDVDDTSEVISMVLQSKMTNAALCQDMARREGLFFHVDQTGFHFHARRPQAKPVAKYIYYTDKTGTIRDTPSIIKGTMRRPTTVVAVGRDLMKKEKIAAQASNSTDTGRPGLAAGVPQVAASVAADGTMTRNPTAGTSGAHVIKTTEKTAESAQRQANGAFNNAASGVIQLKIPLVGDPSLTAKCVVTLEGIGKNLSGNYYLTKVTHKGEGGKYETDADGRRDGHSQIVPGTTSTTAALNKQTGAGAASTDLQRKVIVDPDGTQHTVYEDARGKGK